MPDGHWPGRFSSTLRSSYDAHVDTGLSVVDMVCSPIQKEQFNDAVCSDPSGPAVSLELEAFARYVPKKSPRKSHNAGAQRSILFIEALSAEQIYSAHLDNPRNSKRVKEQQVSISVHLEKAPTATPPPPSLSSEKIMVGLQLTTL